VTTTSSNRAFADSLMLLLWSRACNRGNLFYGINVTDQKNLSWNLQS